MSDTSTVCPPGRDSSLLRDQMRWMNRALAALALGVAACGNVATSGPAALQRQSALAETVGCTPSGRDPRTVGVVVLYAGHAFEETSGAGVSRHVPPPGTTIFGLVRVLEGAGFKVIVPDMPWTLAHPYDRTLTQSLDEIEAAVAELKARGAAVVVVTGHSFGGGIAVEFGARRKGVAGVVALVAGVDPSRGQQKALRANSVAKARRMVAAGQGNDSARFVDVVSLGIEGDVNTTAADYLSFFDPDSGMSLHRALTDWPAELPLLWIDGSTEAGLPARVRMLRAQLPQQPPSRYLTVSAPHTEVGDVAAPLVTAWIRCL